MHSSIQYPVSSFQYAILYDGIMSVLYIAIPAALLLAIVGVVGFIWSVRGGQLDDLETPGVRPLLEDDPMTGTEDED